MKVIMGADHGGFEMKEKMKAWLVEEGFLVKDVGAPSLTPGDDFVDYAKAAVQEATSSDDRIILFCRNGFGMAIAANRFVGVRCGMAFNEEAVRKGRLDDDINGLSIPADYIDDILAQRMIGVFLKEDFSRKDFYMRRIMKLDNLLQ
jgi:ribose 5-phosphate isomerase B